ncbi:hypothetical protein SPB21_33590 [Leptothoe sp. ISB3NOV94-8A]
MYKILTASLVFAIAVGCNNFLSDRKESAAPASSTTDPVEIRPSNEPTTSVLEPEVTVSLAQSETLYRR